MNKAYLKELAALEQEFAAKKSDLIKKYEIISALPDYVSAPDFVHFFKKSMPTLNWKVKTIHDALLIMKHFGRAYDVVATFNGCMYVSPKHLVEQEVAGIKPTWETKDCFEVSIHGSGYEATEINWYTRLGSSDVKMSISIEQRPLAWKQTPIYHGEILLRVEKSSPMASISANHIQWSSPGGYRFSYYFESKESLIRSLAVGNR